MIKRLCVLVTIFFICGILYSQENAIYHNLELGYTLRYPNDWEIEEDTENETISIFKYSQTSLIQTHIQISVARWEDGNLSEFVKAINLENMGELYADFSIKNTLQEEEKCMYELSYILNEVKVNSIFYFQKENDNIYIFLAMSENSEDYESNKETFMNIIDSIEFQ